MIELTPAERYTEKLMERLSSLYGEYNKELLIIQSHLKDSSPEVLETFINIEQHRFQQISSIERVLVTHLNGCRLLFQNNAKSSLEALRRKAHFNNGEIQKNLVIEMDRIGSELSSIRLPVRAKNYKQESAPVLIDIKT